MRISVNYITRKTREASTTKTHLRYRFRWFQMDTAHVDDVGRDRSRRFGDVMRVLKDHGRADRRRQVVRPRVGVLYHSHVVIGPEHVVRQQGRVVQPVEERFGHRVWGHYVRDASRVGHVPGEVALDGRDHRRRYHVDDRHVQRDGYVRHAVVRHGLDDEQVETAVRPAAAGRQYLFEPVAAVGHVAEQSVEGVQLADGPERVAEIVQQRYQVLVDLERVVGRRVHHREVGRRRVVAVAERRQHGDRVPGPGQRPEHRAHEVPVAPGPDRFHGQYPRAVRRRGPTVADHREHQ